MRARKIVQLMFLGLFLALFFLAKYPFSGALPADIFLRIDPLIAISTSLASRTITSGFFLSLLLIGATLFIGRFFCGYVCPLGTVIDLSDRFFKRRKRRVNEFKELQNIKYYILASVLVSAIAAISLFVFLDPISLITRTFAVFLYPLVIFVLNLFLDIIRPLAHRLDLTSLAYTYYIQPVFAMNALILVIFAVVIGLNAIQPRFWCRNLCPLGALLSVFSRFGLWKRKVADGCIDCGRCQRDCPMGAIKEDPRETSARECIQCQTCSAVCPESVISFPASSLSPAGYEPEVDLSRRNFLFSAGIGLLTGFLANTTTTAKVRDDRLLRPPGAIPEAMFLDTCVRCGECIKACVTNTIQPSGVDTGWEGLWTPRLNMRLAACEQKCNVCGMVCPTQAIRKLDLREKKFAKIGTAVINRHKCLVWEQDKLCLICDEQCPYNAIIFKTVEGMRRPFVLEDRCNGCGQCEHKCPVQGEAAIVVTYNGEIRLKEGSYIEETRRRGIELIEREGEYVSPTMEEDIWETEEEIPEGFMPDDSGTEDELPPGFITD